MRSTDEVYYRNAGRIALFNRISLRVRREIFDAFMATVSPNPEMSVLDVGVSNDIAKPETNLLEQLYPYREKIVCAGIGDGSGLAAAYPGVRFVRIEPGAALPFGDGEFDVAYSNAVLEHVGDREKQRSFVRELCRVARRVFLVVPNRLFPIEHHTGLPFLHYLPLGLFRFIISKIGLAFWADEGNLNPLLAHELRGLFPAGAPVKILRRGLGFGVFKSNLIAIR